MVVDSGSQSNSYYNYSYGIPLSQPTLCYLEPRTIYTDVDPCSNFVHAWLHGHTHKSPRQVDINAYARLIFNASKPLGFIF